MSYSLEEQVVILPLDNIGRKDRFLEKIFLLIDGIAFSSLILALTGGFGIYASYYIEGVPWLPASGILLILVSFSVYNLNRKTDEQEDEINHRERFSFTKKYKKLLFYAAVVSYAAALSIGFFYGMRAFFVTCIPLLSGILYSEPVLPVSWKYKRLKEIPVVKNVLVAGAWALTLALLPISMNPAGPGIRILISGLFFFTYVFMASVLPDIRDREGDATVGITTLPVLVGNRTTNLILVAVTSVLGGAIVLTGSRYAPAGIILLLVTGISYMMFCILSMERLIRTNIVCDYLADGGFIFFGLVTLLFTLSGIAR